MQSREEIAVENRNKGMNCAQAVACAYKDYANLEEDTLAAMTQPLGVGIGGTLEGTCGAVSSACMILGLANKEKEKMKAMQDAKALIHSFKECNQSVTCKELKGIETGVMLRSCEGCIRDAARILGEILEDGQEA